MNPSKNRGDRMFDCSIAIATKKGGMMDKVLQWATKTHSLIIVDLKVLQQ
jgi:predicted Fe-Mo cluster-binding NifX family protein